MNVFLGPAFDIAGYAFAPAAVIAPFTGFNVAFNTFLAPYSLGERLSKTHQQNDGVEENV